MINSIKFGKACGADAKPVRSFFYLKVLLEIQKLSRSATLHPASFENNPMSNRYWKINNFRLESQ